MAWTPDMPRAQKEDRTFCVIADKSVFCIAKKEILMSDRHVSDRRYVVLAENNQR